MGVTVFPQLCIINILMFVLYINKNLYVHKRCFLKDCMPTFNNDTEPQQFPIGSSVGFVKVLNDHKTNDKDVLTNQK
jgi:hypothetical protein